MMGMGVLIIDITYSFSLQRTDVRKNAGYDNKGKKRSLRTFQLQDQPRKGRAQKGAGARQRKFCESKVDLQIDFEVFRAEDGMNKKKKINR